MFGQRPAFGAPATPAFGAATPGAAAATGAGSAFGAAPSAFGATSAAPAFGTTATAAPSLWNNAPAAQPAAGSLFGASTAPTANTGSLFGTTAPSAFGAPAAATQTSNFGTTNAFGAASAFKPAATGFGAPAATGAGFGATTTSAGGLFGTTATPATGGGGLFRSGTTGAFGAGGGAFGAAAGAGFGATGTTIKFEPPSSTDTMLKSGTQQNINTRHLCITCMKEYENKSIEELRFEDYAANRKGPQAGGTQPAGGLFGAAPNQVAPVSQAGGLFGSQAQPAAGGLFGTQTQNKPLFGQSTTAPAFGAATSTFGTTTGAFGTPTSTTGGGLFGQKPGGAFGAPASTSSGFSFGGTATATAGTTGGLFGQPARPFGAAQPQQQSTGMFGATSATPGFGSAATNTFGTPATSFGQPATSQPQSIGLFGAQSKPAGFGTAATTGFGQPATSTAAPAFGTGFGGVATSTANPFGQTAAAKPAFGGFGAATSQPSAFGQPAAGGFGAMAQPAAGGLFGAAKPAAAAPAFGAPATSQPAAGFGSFGSSTSAFGSTAGGAGLFGAAQPKPGLFGATNTGFGAPTAGFGAGAGTSAFGTAATGFGGAASGGLGAFGAGTSAFGGLGTQQAMPATQAVPAAATGQSVRDYLSSLTNNPYGDDPLYKNLVPGAQSDEKLSQVLKPTNSLAQKAVLANRYKISPHRNVMVKPKSLNASGSAGSGHNKTSSLFDGLEDDEDAANKSTDLFVPKSSVKKLVLKTKSPRVASTALASISNAHNITNDESLLDKDESVVFPSVKDVVKKSSPLPAAEDSFSALNTRKKPAAAAAPPKDNSDANITMNIPTAGGGGGALSDSASSGREDLDDSSSGCDENRHPAGVVLKRPQYYTIPPMSELAAITDADGNCLVENFTVGRAGYGNVFFPGMTNVRGLNLDDIVFFRNKEVIVYPDDHNKPPLGEGLNKKAQVTLDKVWPFDKTKQQPITDPEKLQDLQYEDRLCRACVKLDAKFVEYRPETGSWVFKVDHFSKYGLDDSDEENENPKKEIKKVKTAHVKNPKTVTTVAAVHAEPVQKSSLNLSLKKAPPPVHPMDDKVQHMRATLFDSDSDDAESPPNVDLSKLASQAPLPQPRPVILEQRDKSLVEDIAMSLLTGSDAGKGLGGSFAMDFSSAAPVSLTSSLLRSQFLPKVEAATTTPAKKCPRYTLQGGYDQYVTLPTAPTGTDQRPKVIVPRHLRPAPLHASLLNPSRLKHVADAGFFMSRRFRVGWGSHGLYAHAGASALDVDRDPYSVVIEQRTAEGPGTETEQIQSLEAWLEVSLENAVCVAEESRSSGDVVPKFEPETGPRSLEAHREEAVRQLESGAEHSGNWQASLNETKDVWELMTALWGQLDEDEGREGHHVTMRRKERLSAWLEHVVDASAQDGVKAAKRRGNVTSEMLALLSANRLEEACDRAQAAGDHYAALAASVSSGESSFPAEQLLKYLDLMQEVRADQHVDDERLKLYALLSGTPVWPASDDKTINACQGLDWTRALAVVLWFFCTPVSSVSDALAAFEDAFQGLSPFGAYAQAPRPRLGLQEDAFDVKYHLLKLYADRGHPLEVVVTPTTHAASHTDHRLGWFLARVLETLGYRHMAVHRRDQHHLEFAAQLEAGGLWHWAVYVLLHLHDPDHRQTKVGEVLGRHVRLDDDISAEREAFVHEHLRVPVSWIARAKATRAAFEGSYGSQAWFLIKANDWNAAHSVIVKEIAPDAIIGDNYDFFYELLKHLADDSVSSSVTDWHLRGAVYYDFISVDVEVRQLLEERDESKVGYYIERLRPQVMNICSRINGLPTDTAKNRLCQAEIAKKVAHLMRAVMSLDGEGNTAVLAEHLSQLPLPDDYELQELRTLTRMYMKELIES